MESANSIETSRTWSDCGSWVVEGDALSSADRCGFWRWLSCEGRGIECVLEMLDIGLESGNDLRRIGDGFIVVWTATLGGKLTPACSSANRKGPPSDGLELLRGMRPRVWDWSSEDELGRVPVEAYDTLNLLLAGGSRATPSLMKSSPSGVMRTAGSTGTLDMVSTLLQLGLCEMETTLSQSITDLRATKRDRDRAYRGAGLEEGSTLKELRRHCGDHR